MSCAMKVLIAMDGSKHAEFALRYYAENCHKEGDEVFVLYSTEYGHLFQQPLFSADPQLVAHLATEEEKEVEKLMDKLTKLTTNLGLKAQVVRVPAGSSAGEAVVRWAKEHQVTLIVTGTRGQSKLRRTLMGSVSQYIVHHAHSPVLVCRDK